MRADSIDVPEIVTTVLAWRPDGWEVTRGADTRKVCVDPTEWNALPATLEPGATEHYRRFAESADYLRWWAAACGDNAPGIRRFAVRTASEHWERPWESTIAALDESRWQDVAMIRLVAGQRASVAPWEIGRPMRVLVVQGQAAGEGLDRLNLTAELNALRQARSRLDSAAKKLVPRIEARAPGDAELVGALSETKPTLLWLSGHARADPPGFLLADGSWLSPGCLASAVGDASKTSGVVPLYVVLWACKTGLAERFAAPGAAPPFIAELAKVGVSAVLATLGPLADDIAPDVAAAVLRTVALGRPLDHAIARGRAELMTRLAKSDRDDWACPVVWCVDLPPAEIVWSNAAAPAQRQDLARRLLPPRSEPAELDATGRAQAASWSRHRRVWVTESEPGTWEVRSAWLGRVLAQQRINRRMVVTLDFRGSSSSRGVLREWAERVLRVTDGFDDPGREFRVLADITKDDQEAGWRGLCERRHVTLALITPPEDDWLWRTLHGAPASALVLADDFPPWAAKEWKEWQLETLRVSRGPVDFDPFPDPFASGLAVLAFPAAAQDLAAIDAKQVASLRNAGLLIDTRAGCRMPLWGVKWLAERLDPEQRAEAHRRAFAMLNGNAARAAVRKGDNEALLQARLLHAGLAADRSAFSTAAQQLMDYYRRHRRASALLEVFGSVDFREIDEVWQVAVGWAYLATGCPDKARDWLEEVDDELLEPVDQAERLALIAELEKSSGAADSKTRARQSLEKALSVLGGKRGEAVMVTRLRIEHELARLTHFIDGEPAKAIKLYRKVGNAWETIPGYDLDAAITLRNLSEAEMTLGDLGSAWGDLAKARDKLPANTGDPLAAELEYFAGRLAIRREDEESATDCFKRAKAVGRARNHLMLAAIAEARLFWREVARESLDEYDPGEWEKRKEDLLPYKSHAWAARVLIDGYLRSARRLADRGRMRLAGPPLRAAHALLAANPAFDQGSDRRRIVATCAGLAVTGNDRGPWDGLPTRFAWFAKWLADEKLDTPEMAWEAAR